MKTTKFGATLLAAGALLLATPAANAATHPDVTVTGAGATFPLNMIEQWKADFKTASNVTIAYTGVGSGAGRSQLIAGTVDFAGSDTAASADETNQLNGKYGSFVYLPETSGGISVIYKVAGLSNLKLSAPTLAKIFNGTITNWNDPAIAADNGTAGPNLPIQVFVRSDKSGTSGVFTDYLSKAGGGAWTVGSTQTFPTDHGQIGKAGSDGVANAVVAANGGIGYAEHSFAVERSLGEVAVKNGAGGFKTPGDPNVTAAIDDATINPDGTLTLNYLTTAPEAYPISTVSYLLVPTKLDASKGDNLKAFIAYALSSTGQGKAPALGYAPLPAKILSLSVAQAAKINPEPVTTTTTTTAPPTTTTTVKKTTTTIRAAVVPAAPDPALAKSGRNFAAPVTVGSLLTLAGVALLAQGRRARRARHSS